MTILIFVWSSVSTKKRPASRFIDKSLINIQPNTYNWTHTTHTQGKIQGVYEHLDYPIRSKQTLSRKKGHRVKYAESSTDESITTRDEVVHDELSTPRGAAFRKGTTPEYRHCLIQGPMSPPEQHEG